MAISQDERINRGHRGWTHGPPDNLIELLNVYAWSFNATRIDELEHPNDLGEAPYARLQVLHETPREQLEQTIIFCGEPMTRKEAVLLAILFGWDAGIHSVMEDDEHWLVPPEPIEVAMQEIINKIENVDWHERQHNSAPPQTD